MKSLIRSIAVAGVVAAAAAAGAQTPSGVVNSIVLKRLVAADTPDAHRVLTRHFAALADTYAADAERDRALATAFIGNPNRTFGSSPGAQYARLARLATEWERAARDIAAYHQALAAGTRATPPARITFFHSGGGAPAPTEAELRELKASARSASDHHDLEEYYLTLAATYKAWGDKHVAMAQALRANANQRGTHDPASHCDRVAHDAYLAANNARTQAAEQHQLASVAE